MMIASTEMTMSRRIRNGCALFLTVATSVLMFGGVITPDMADASVGIVTRWPATPQIVTTSSSASAKVYPGTDSNRLLLVAVACEYSAATAGTQTMNVQFGGQTLTQLATNTTGASTIWIGYLNENGIKNLATSHFLTVSQSHTARTLTAMYATAAVFNGVDQTTPTGTALTTYTASATTMSLSSLAVYGLTGNTGMSVYVANWNGQSSTPYTGYTELTDYAGPNFNLATSFKQTTSGTEATITSTTTPSLISGAMAGVGINPATNVSTITTCGGCHGNPPFDGLGRNKIQGTFSGSHTKHTGYAYGEAALACSKCHYNHTTNNHQTGFKNITGSALPGNAYSLTKKIAVTNGTGNGTCTTVYCHSNGRSTVANRKYVPAASTRWGGPATTCISCHGGRAGATTINSVGSTAGFRLSSTHSQHLKYPAANINCQMCHSMTNVNDAWTLRPYSSQPRHVNGVVDVTFTDVVYGSYTSYKSSSSGSGGTDKRCGNVSCHGGTTRTGWSEGPVTTTNTCVHCHGDATYTGAGNVTANRKNFAPGWAGTGTSTDGRSNTNDIRVGAHFSHLSSAHMSMLKCTECHTVPDTPFSGTHMALPRYNSQTLTFLQASSATRNGIAFPSYTSGTSTKAATCSTVYCHGAKMRNGDTSGSYRKPSWNMELTTSVPDATTCGRCHGMPPTTGTTTELHAPYTLISDCTTCHTSVVNATGKIINKKLHMDGKLQAPGSPCNGCHSAKSSDTYFVSASAHKFHVYTSIKWASDYQMATETELYRRTSESSNIPDTYKFKCGVCHDSTQTRPLYAEHMAGNVSPDQAAQVYFGYYTTTGKTGAYVAGGSLAGTDSKGSKTWTAGSTTPGTSCMTTYCHSNGRSGAEFVAGQPVSWATTTRTATPDRCSLCHGGARGTANPMNTGKHNRHMNNWTTQGASLQKCTACHAGTVSNNTVILPASVRHVNKQLNYSGIYSGDNYNPATKTCSAFYCHSDSKGRFINPGTWTAGQGPKNCDGCHGRSADGSQSNSDGIGFPNYTNAGKNVLRSNSHKKHVTQLGITDTRGCAKCHRSTIDRNFANRQHPLSSNHLDGNTNADIKPDRTAGISFAYTTGTKTCSAASCHKSGRLDKTLYANVQWGDTGNCRMCHGGRASGAMGGYSASRSGFNLSTTHKQHLKYPATYISCQTCHYKTAADAATFKPFSGPLKHNNNKREVRLGGLVYGGYTAFKSWSSSERPTARNDKTCANTSCHGGTTRNAWQKTTYNGDNSCVHCHGVAGTTTSNTDKKNFAPGWKTTGIDTDGNSVAGGLRVGAHFVHLSSVYMPKLKCNECHLVPSTPFDPNAPTHMEALRYNSQGINFDQSSSAKLIGGATRTTVTYPFTGYTAGTGTKAATCSSVYCHGYRLKNAVTSGTNRKPSWNNTTLTPSCTPCHGNPPLDGGLHAAGDTTCNDCHTNVTSGVNPTTFIDKSLHINGKVEASAKCTGCHASAKTRTMGRPGATLSAVMGEFNLAYGHKPSSRVAKVTDADCIVCHLEGVFSTQKTNDYNSSTNPTGTHKNGNIDLRDPDGTLNGGETPITNIGGGAFTFQRFSTSYAAASRTSTGHTSTTDIANVISQKFCLACHDSNGAANTTARSNNGGTGTAAMPFGGILKGATYTTANGATAAGTQGLIDVKTQTATTNSSVHPIQGPRFKGYPTPALMKAPYNNFTRTGGTKSNGVVMNCFDCHNVAGTSPLTRRTVTAHGNAAIIRGTIYVPAPTLCTVCHTNTMTSNHQAGSALATSLTYSHSTSDVTAGCNGCHGSADIAPARPIRAADYHGYNKLLSGANWPTINKRPYGFIRNTVNFNYHNPAVAASPDATTAVTPTCLANTTTDCTRTVMQSATSATYSPGGQY